MEIRNFEFHIHKWVHDSQGAIYCEHCHKFKGWMPGELEIHEEKWPLGQEDGTVKIIPVTVHTGWGYLLNGEEWKKKEEEKIKSRDGLYI
jgi:hypothetical protein